MKTSTKTKLAQGDLRIFPKVISGIARKITKFDYRFLGGRSLGPTNAVLEITSRCNLRCEFCWLWGESGVGKKYAKEEMSTEEVKNVIDSLPATCYLVYIAGGEPFIRKDILEIIKYTKSKGTMVNLTTNGMLIGKMSKGIIESGLDQINISVDGMKETHDSIRGRGSFDKVMENTRKLIEEKKLRGSKRPIIKLNTTISTLNYSNLVPMMELASDIGVDRLTFQHLWFTSKELATSHKEMMKKFFDIDCKGIFGYVNERIHDIDEKVLEPELAKIREISKKTGVDVKFWPDLSKRGMSFSDYRDLDHIMESKCLHPWFVVNIKPNGDVVPCTDYYIPEYIVGNLKEKRLKDLWNSARFITFRKKLKQCGIFPGCRRCCGLV